MRFSHSVGSFVRSSKRHKVGDPSGQQWISRRHFLWGCITTKPPFYALPWLVIDRGYLLWGHITGRPPSSDVTFLPPCWKTDFLKHRSEHGSPCLKSFQSSPWLQGKVRPQLISGSLITCTPSLSCSVLCGLRVTFIPSYCLSYLLTLPCGTESGCLQSSLSLHVAWPTCCIDGRALLL